MHTLEVRPIIPADDTQIASIINAARMEAGNIVAKSGRTIPAAMYTDDQLVRLSTFYDRTPNAAYWVLSDESGVIYGGVGIGPLTDGVAELQRFYIAKNHRGAGGGQRLLDQALAYAQTCYRQVYLETFRALGAANHLYQKNGFVLLKQAPKAAASSVCDAWWLKTFNN
ncbi:GNAT family N-acetyltransferase [Lacticaseibacillus zhaodongensis]|uniref:GNAT family N-acetyltransferase n=1 Tax=Lacticaseibacillus zhaodongensis TaxID=2668065 RepID=UPI0012D370FD|nr:GNAT family N-acetyltransferase [Lacticaseibacillus zhaodongensis]